MKEEEEALLVSETASDTHITERGPLCSKVFQQWHFLCLDEDTA